MKGCLHFSCTYTITLKNQVVWTMSEIVEWSSGVVKTSTETSYFGTFGTFQTAPKFGSRIYLILLLKS